jgi:hypothetical protein
MSLECFEEHCIRSYEGWLPRLGESFLAIACFSHRQVSHKRRAW